MAKDVVALKRILKDLQEVLENPVKNVVAAPLQDNLFCWHGNVRGSEGALEGVVIHFSLTFQNTYPDVQPAIHLMSPVPHPNVRRALSDGPGPARWTLALWDCIPSFKGWTSCYTVLSILVQLQAFLLQEDLQYNTSVISTESAIERARTVKCSCGHEGAGGVHPKLCSLNSMPPRRKKVYLCNPVATKPRQKQQPPAGLPKPAAAATTAAAVSPAPAAGAVSPLPAAVAASGEGAGLEWTTVQHKHGKKGPGYSEVAPPPEPVPVSVSVGNHFAVLEAEEAVTTDLPASSSTLPAPGKLGTSLAPGAAATAPSATPVSSQKGAKKRLARSKKRQLAATTAKQAVVASVSPQPGPSKPTAEPHPDTWQAVHSKKPAGGASLDEPQIQQPIIRDVTHASVDVTQLSHKELIGRLYQSHEAMSDAPGPLPTETASSGITAEQVAATGTFAGLDQESLHGVLSLLDLPELGALASTCRGLRAACEDGLVWKSLLERMYPCSFVGGASLKHWKHAFLLEHNNIVDELRCFHTKNTHEEDVLGFPVRYTVNPVKKTADYIEACPELLSLGAFRNAGVRRDVHNETFQQLLPLFLTQDHFASGRRHLERTVAHLAAPDQGASFRPTMLLDVISRVLNTAVVLLVDQGVSASEKALDCYCMVHRLLLGAIEHYGLGNEVRRRVVHFNTKPEMREKAECPSLGDWMPLIGVDSQGPADGHAAWLAVARSLIGEILDRQILWICKHDPELAQCLRKSPQNTDADMKLLQGAFQASKVSLRLVMFHVGFLRLVACPQSAEAHDILYGRPSLALKRQFQAYVKAVITVDTFPAFFSIVGLQVPSPAHLTSLLRHSWDRSLKKGYHRRNMDFSRVHSSGVSKILLKGQSFTAPPNLKRVVMQEHWQWTGSGTKFLDASCLVFDWQGNFIANVDYASLSWQSIRHSGDIIEDGKGTHTIHVDLSALPKTVKALYFTMSGWSGATLAEFRLPYVSLSEEEGMELCQYNFEKTPDANRKRAIVMCSLTRGSVGSSWTCAAVGEVCMGCAGDYDPMVNFIKRLR
ncbi:hypothetical protein CYMTET_46556 [Cymbomonas tetramitiformis]|uniref:UBC core domain-containing protein n=1 Tax=Cymbomonas tetramitiformis TaxID=36881 RepID=A0AAE0BXX6_9CHLO|nr:hypothetical protein CYMTET_46556 [Cymbomonas tetramitiformis]